LNNKQFAANCKYIKEMSRY